MKDPVRVAITGAAGQIGYQLLFRIAADIHELPFEKGAKRGQWTYADYLRLPNDGKRYEIINGGPLAYQINNIIPDHFTFMD